jgi:type III restriction enzyme
MASLILYYYKAGYRNFIFFVNQNNIVGKTEDNLLDSNHTKYLFSSPIVIDDKTVKIKQVAVFSHETHDIEIIFTSIHKLHNSVYEVKENAIFLDDLQRRNLVLLADEAHNFNASTKKGNQKGNIDFKDLELKPNSSADDVERSWEHTIITRILNKDNKVVSNNSENGLQNNLPNVLLEFTATVPQNTNVVQKYLDKIIFKFDLREFLTAGFTKTINLISSNFDRKQRITQALLFNWYRSRIAQDYDIFLKPVVLFRSKTITSSEENYNFFREFIDTLRVEDLQWLQELDLKTLAIDNSSNTKSYEKGQSRLIDIQNYLQEKQIKLGEIVEFFKYNFQDKNCIITNSKTNKTQKEKTDDETNSLLNSLEDKNNHITAIFTVKRLTEGWDVLNLFDIVRMYEGQNTGGSNKGQAGESTISEVQLIGRGIRYCPFIYKDKVKNKRKFDNDSNHDLRVLEEFYFHSDKDERYISELTQELKRQDLLPKEDTKQITFDFKEEYKPNKETSPFHHLEIYINERANNPNRRKINLQDLQTHFDFEFVMDSLFYKEQKRVLEKDISTAIETQSQDKKTEKFVLADFAKYGKHIVLKALQVHAKKEHSIFRFSKLKEELAIQSVSEILQDDFFGKLPIKIIAPKTDKTQTIALENIAPHIQLEILLRFFDKVALELSKICNISYDA